MQLVMLGGNSLHNRDWLYRVRQHVETLFDGTYVQEYEHWRSGGVWVDIQHELSVVRAGRTGYGAEYGVFAKSIGCVIAAQAIEQGMLRPQFLLLCGLPFGYIKQDYQGFANSIAAARVPVTVIQNEHDPAGGAAEVDDYLKQSFAGRSDCHFMTTPGESHDYEDLDLLREQLRIFIGV